MYREVHRAASLGLWLKLLLGVVKLVSGIVGQSFALVADAVNSLGDVVSTLIVLFALRVAQLPRDKEHPYGHSRAERHCSQQRCGTDHCFGVVLSQRSVLTSDGGPRVAAHMDLVDRCRQYLD